MLNPRCLLVVALVLSTQLGLAAELGRGRGYGRCNGPGNGTRIEGVITAIDAATLQFTIEATTVQVTAETWLQRNGRSIAFDDLVVGQTVAACGQFVDDILVAQRVTVRLCGR